MKSTNKVLTEKECKICNCLVLNVDINIKEVKCSRCTQGACLALDDSIFKIAKIKKTKNRPKGWHWMKEFVDDEGNVFHKGKEVSELKGTLEPTKFEKSKKPRKKKQKKEKTFSEMRDIVKQQRGKQKSRELKKKQIQKEIQKQKDFISGRVKK